jgi:CRP-like cAMP-binding protein
MPKPMQFKAGMVIYIEGDLHESIYVLQSGAVHLAYPDLETGSIQHKTLQRGEFFGVKSAIGKYPREETATVTEDCIVFEFSVPEFEAVAIKNPSIIMQMLKVYSAQLRKTTHLLSRLKIQSRVRRHSGSSNLGLNLNANPTQTPEDGLFNIGKHYLARKKQNEAEYVFKKYMENYPEGKHLDEVRSSLVLMGVTS